jgi:hypothetical protein
MKASTLLSLVLLLIAGLAAGMAQDNQVRIINRHGVFEGALPPPNVSYEFNQTFAFAKAEMAFDGKVVKGAPYAADAVTETTQTLADGNHIRRTTKAALYRDSQGRTRREQTLGEVGPLVAADEPLQTIVISDPVAGATYMLDPQQHVAHKMPGPNEPRLARAQESLRVAKTKTETEMGSAGAQIFFRKIKTTEGGAPPQVKEEALGGQTIEGVVCEGTRRTLTIPAGQIGNERPIEVVTENWYSTQLQTMVMTRTTDPRFGETVYKLVNVKLNEPAESLFTVPADYTVK